MNKITQLHLQFSVQGGGRATSTIFSIQGSGVPLGGLKSLGERQNCWVRYRAIDLGLQEACT